MREQYYRRTYGVSFEDLNRLLEAQKGRCGICGTYWKDCPAPKASRYEAVFVQHLYVDHDHATGKVRGLLCNLCNIAIAYLKDDVRIIEAAKAYIEKWRD